MELLRSPWSGRLALAVLLTLSSTCGSQIRADDVELVTRPGGGGGMDALGVFEVAYDAMRACVYLSAVSSGSRIDAEQRQRAVRGPPVAIRSSTRFRMRVHMRGSVVASLGSRCAECDGRGTG